MTLFLDTKVQEAIDFLREHEPHEGYVLKFSGGKDSIVLYDIAKASGVKFSAFYNCTTIDPPEVTRFILKHYPEIKWIRPKRSFFDYVARVGPPTRVKRWCCSKMKHYVPKNISRHVVLGVRAEESYKRKRREMINENKEVRTIDYYPLFFWTEADIWDYIESRGLPYPSLYDEGFSRLGCVVCPFICRSGVLEMHRRRWSKHYELFEKAVTKFFESKKDWFRKQGINDVKEFLELWYAGKGITREDKEESEVLFK